MTKDEKSEAQMIGELAPRILRADAEGESCAMEMHALEAMVTPTGKALKRALFVEMGWRRAFMAEAAIKRLRGLVERKG